MLLVEVTLACCKFLGQVLVDKLGCDSGPRRKETCMDGFEPCGLHGDEARSMKVPYNLLLGCTVIDAVCGVSVELLFRANIP